MNTSTHHIDGHGQIRAGFQSRMLPFVTTTFALLFATIGLPRAAAAAITPITTCPSVITSPGQYRLDVDCAVGNGVTAITIAASDVRLNLNEHTISGPISTASDCSVVTSNTGIQLGGANVQVNNGQVVRFSRGIQTVGPAGHDNQASNLTVTGNCEGIVAFSSDNNVINGNNLSGNWEMGLRFQDSHNNRASNNVVNNNGPIAGGAGVFLANSNANVINGNEIHVNQNESGMWLLNSHDNVIRNNRLNGNSQHGIRIEGDGSSRNTVQANTAVLNGADLADFNASCINIWKSNTFYTDTDSGAGAGPNAGCIQ